MAPRLAELAIATSSDLVEQALDGLGALSPRAEHLDGLAAALSRYALVAVGPAATRFWHTEGSRHAQAMCMFCKPFALQGTREHTHAAFLHEGVLNDRQPRFAQKKKTPPAVETVTQRAAATRVFDSRLAPKVTTSSDSIALPRRAATASQRQLADLLTACDMAAHTDAFLHAEVTVDDLCRFELQDIEAIFGLPQSLGRKLMVMARRSIAASCSTPGPATSGAIVAAAATSATASCSSAASAACPSQLRLCANVMTGIVHRSSDGIFCSHALQAPRSWGLRCLPPRDGSLAKRHSASAGSEQVATCPLCF